MRPSDRVGTAAWASRIGPSERSADDVSPEAATQRSIDDVAKRSQDDGASILIRSLSVGADADDQARHEAGPARLVHRAHAAAGVSVEVLVEEQVVLEVRVLR